MGGSESETGRGAWEGQGGYGKTLAKWGGRNGRVSMRFRDAKIDRYTTCGVPTSVTQPQNGNHIGLLIKVSAL